MEALITMKNIAGSALSIRAIAVFLLIFVALSGCTLPRPASTPVVYDFGPGVLQATASTPSVPQAVLAPIEISAPHPSTALAGVAVLYRLGYADAQVLQPYALARWSMPPAQLIDQRLRARLSQQRSVLAAGELLQASPPRRSASATSATVPPTAARGGHLLSLRLTLDEFSHLFTSPSQSSGLLHLRVTLTQRAAAGDTLLGQRSFIVQQPAPSLDARGGVRALAAAADVAIDDIAQWLAQTAPM